MIWYKPMVTSDITRVHTSEDKCIVQTVCRLVYLFSYLVFLFYEQY
jgi:hypothetical protein